MMGLNLIELVPAAPASACRHLLPGGEKTHAAAPRPYRDLKTEASGCGSPFSPRGEGGGSRMRGRPSLTLAKTVRFNANDPVFTNASDIRP